MDRKLIIGGIVAAIVILSALGMFALKGSTPAAVPESPSTEVDTRTEIQPASGQPGAPTPKMPDGRPLPM